jgi:hypothetical protein
MSQPGIEPWPPEREASTLEKSHLDSLFASYLEPLLGLRLALQQQPDLYTANNLCQNISLILKEF